MLQAQAMDPTVPQLDVSQWQLKVFMRRLTREQSQLFSSTDNDTKLVGLDFPSTVIYSNVPY